MNKATKASKKDKLALKREILKRLNLDEKELAQVAGGTPCTAGSIVPSAPG